MRTSVPGQSFATTSFVCTTLDVAKTFVAHSQAVRIRFTCTCKLPPQCWEKQQGHAFGSHLPLATPWRKRFWYKRVVSLEPCVWCVCKFSVSARYVGLLCHFPPRACILCMWRIFSIQEHFARATLRPHHGSLSLLGSRLLLRLL